MINSVILRNESYKNLKDVLQNAPQGPTIETFTFGGGLCSIRIVCEEDPTMRWGSAIARAAAGETVIVEREPGEMVTITPKDIHQLIKEAREDPEECLTDEPITVTVERSNSYFSCDYFEWPSMRRIVGPIIDHAP